MPSKLSSKNPNWKGGISKLKNADEILRLPSSELSRIVEELKAYSVVDLNTGCWNWTKSIFKSNGRARFSRLGLIASRVSYVVFKGKAGFNLVCHSCDNVLCINPDHLWLGTPKDNSQDMVRKKRAATGIRNGAIKYPERLVRGNSHPNRKYPERVQGENNGRALLTEDDVREIRRLYRPFMNNHKPSNQKELAERFGVAQHVIKCVVKGITWKCVK